MTISKTSDEAEPTLSHAEQQAVVFPAATTTLSGMIRTFDWSHTNLGPITLWPQSLKVVVDLILQSPVPIVTLWGQDGVMIYNDAYAVVAGGRHPTLLGSKVLEGWPEVAAFNQHVMAVGLRGERLSYHDQHLVLFRTGAPEDVWLDLNYSPILDERGSPTGVMAIVVETTQRVLEERRRKEAEERLHLALDVVDVIGVCDYHLATGIVYADAHFAEMFSLDKEVAAQGAPLDVYLARFHPEDVERATTAIEQTITTRSDYALEHRLLREDGEVRWIFARGGIFDAGHEQPLRLLVVAIDITEQKRTEEALRASQAELELITDEIPELVSYVDRTLVYRFVNRTYEDWFDRSRESIIGKPVRDVLGPQAYAIREPWLERALAGEEVVFDAILEMQGRRRDTELRLFPRANANGDVEGIYVFVLDVSDRKRAENALRQLTEGLEQQVQERTRERDRIWNVSQDLLGIADFNGVWLNINPAWHRLLGWPTEEIIGRTSEWMEHPDDRTKTRAEMDHLAERTSTLIFENRFRTSDSTYRWLSWTAVPEAGLLYCVARDVTAEKERQAELQRTQEQLRQAQKMEAVGQLTGGIAHDFNNLLTSITGGLDMLQRRVAAGRLDDIDRYINTATTSAKRAAALTHRLLAFSRQQSLDVKPTDINKLILSLEDLLCRTLGESIAFETALQPELDLAMTDSNQLENALLNLCINARDAMPDGGKLTVETMHAYLDASYTRDFSDLTPGEYISMCVSDTGLGIPPDVIERVFDPFFTTKPIGQGTGLGLSMIYGFVKQSGGHIRIYSQLDQGTTVRLYLPRYTGEVEVATVEEAVEGLRAGAGECVLIVEDDPGVRMIVVEVLHDLGYRTVEADEAQTAILQFESGTHIDLLITDVGLPGMNGRQLAEIARQKRPELPILFVTGYAEGAMVRSGFLDPGMEMISKPFAIDSLVAKIQVMIEQRS